MNSILQRVVCIAAAILVCQVQALTSQGATVPLPARLSQAVQKIEVSVDPSTAKRGQTITWRLTIDLAPGWHTYPVHQSEEGKAPVTHIQFVESGDTVVVGDMKELPPKTKPEPALNIPNLLFYEGKVIWEQPLVVLPGARPGDKTIKTKLTLVVCDKDHCLPPTTIATSASVQVSDALPVPVESRYVAEVSQKSNAQATAPPTYNEADNAAERSQDRKESLAQVLAQLSRQQAPVTHDLLSFVLAGIFWGAISLVTPCVFPMIPITVSFFLKQSEKQHHRPLTMALVYCLTIVVVLAIAAVALLSFFRWLSINPVMNFALGGLFVFFALSLFGMYDIELPAGLARFTSAREGRGGLLGTMFMALTFTIVSFACVAPFLGGFGGTAATANMTWLERVLGGLAFSATFAAPFFVLALFPSLLKKLPKSGSWLNSIKVVMGFLELAAALKFFRAGELVLLSKASFFTYDFVLGIWIALSLLCGFYLLNLYRLPYDTPTDHLSVPRLVASLVFLGLGFYLLPALFKYTAGGESQRPNGVIYAWIDSFLLPEGSEGQTGLAWTPDLKRAIDDARAYRRRTGERRLVFVDFTGETCTNCKKNEKTVFSKQEIKQLLQPYELVQLYTDKVPDELYPAAVRAQFGARPTRQRADAVANLWFQREAFGTEQLPLYVILEPLLDGTIDVAGIYPEGLINDEAAFAQFLKKPLETAGEALRARAGNPG